MFINKLLNDYTLKKLLRAALVENLSADIFAVIPPNLLSWIPNDSISSSLVKPAFSFDQAISAIQEEASAVLSLSSQEKAVELANRFFIYLQENLKLFNGADPSLNTLMEHLLPFKPKELRIELLLTKINQDLRKQNEKLKEDSSQKFIPISSSLAAFPRPLLDTSMEYVELTTQFLRKQKDDFSLLETFEMCCFLVAQGMESKATLLFNFHTVKHFLQDPLEFTHKLLEYLQEAEWCLAPTALQTHSFILKKLLQTALIENLSVSIFSVMPPDLLSWISNDEPGEKELFQGYKQLACKEYDKAFEQFLQAAHLGNSQAFVRMGICYWFGEGVPAKDYGRAFELYKEAAELGNSGALLRMGNCYWLGKGVPAKDYKKAFGLFKRAAELGNSEGLVRMGTCYWFGEGVPEDHSKAFELYKQAAELGNSEALVGMGLCYQLGEGVPEDHSKAFELYKRAAELGNSQGLIEMGDCYSSGDGVPAKDYDRAFELYKQAANLGNSLALIKMGNCYWTGNGVPSKDYDRAFELYKEAADLGNSQGFVELGDCYWLAKGVPRSDEEAFACWLKAKNLGNDEGALNVAKSLTWGWGIQENREEAKAILLDLISRGDSDANEFYVENF